MICHCKEFLERNKIVARLLQAMIYHTWCGAQYQCFSEYPIIFSPIVKFAGRCRAVQQQEWWLCHRRRRRRHSSYGRRNWVLALLLLPRHGGGGAGGAGGNGRSIGRSVVGTRSRSSLHTRGAHVKLCYARRRRRWRTYRVTHHMTFTVRRGVSRRRRRRIPCCRLCTYRGCLLCTIRFSDKSKTLLFMRFILQHYDSSTYLLRMRQNAYTLPFARASYWCMKLLILRK